MFEKLIDFFISPFVAILVLIDESKKINEDGSWDKYHEKRNKKAQKRGEKKHR